MREVRYVCLDVETSGLSARKGDRVLEVAAVVVERGAIMDEFDSLIDVECRIQWAAERVHGIRRTMLNGSPRPEEIWPRFLDLAGGSTLVAHNARFDLGFIRHELSRLGLGLNNRSICTVELSRRMYPHLSSHRLETVARHVLGEIPMDCRLHRALGDARLLARVWGKMTQNP